MYLARTLRVLPVCLLELLTENKKLRRGYAMLHENPDIDVLLLDKRGKSLWHYEVKAGDIDRDEAIDAIRYMRSLGIPSTGGFPPLKSPH